LHCSPQKSDEKKKESGHEPDYYPLSPNDQGVEGFLVAADEGASIGNNINIFLLFSFFNESKRF